MFKRKKDFEEFIELLVPYVIKRIKKDGLLKNYVQRKNATVKSKLADGETNIGKNIEVVFPYDTTSFFVRNETGFDLNKGDLVCLEYSIDIKNAIAVYKVN